MRNILYTGLLAGIVAALFFSLVQYVAVNPLIGEAEVLEAQKAAHAAPAASQVQAGAAAHSEPAEAWASGDGLERVGFTLMANLVTGVGFGFVLAGCFALYGGTLNAKRGLLWGLAGYAVFSLAPALGLPPEAPGAAAADLFARQTWWLGTVAATASGLALAVFARKWPFKLAGAALLLAPHLFGAPHHVGDSGVPADLATAFVIASLAATSLFWLVLGGVSGAAYRRLTA